MLTLALGVGATAAIFSVVNAVLLRPLPWQDPDGAVMIWSRWTAFDKTWVAEGEVVDYRRRARTLRDVAAWSETQVNLTRRGEPERVAAASVSANTKGDWQIVTEGYFEAMGERIVRGRGITAADTSDTMLVAVINEEPESSSA